MVPLHFDLFSLITAGSLTVGLVIGFVLIFLPYGNRKANIVFSVFLFLNGGTIFSLGLSTLGNLYMYIPHVIRTGFLFQLLLSPCLYLYFRFLLVRDARLGRKDLLHLVLPVTYFLWQSPFYFASAEYKIRFISYWFYNNSYAAGRWEGIILPLPFILQFIVYTFIISRMISRYYANLSDNYSDYSHKRLNWGSFLFAGFALFIITLIIAYLLWTFNILTLLALSKFLVMAISLFILTLAVNALRQPDLHQYGLVEKPVQDKTPKTDPDTPENEKEYLRLISHMNGREYWRDPNLTLDRLSIKMGISRGNLSRLINQKGGCNFHDFINGFRINEIIRILDIDPKRNILETAISAGFNNKSTFYKIFRKLTGQTPKEYIKHKSKNNRNTGQ